MESRLPKALKVSLVFLMSTLVLAIPVYAVPLVAPPQEPVWVTVNSTAQGNYPGGNELFTIFVVNSAQTRTLNETVDNMTLSAPFSSTCCNNFGTGLPTTLIPGQSLLLTIYLQIPENFSQSSFTANLVAHIRLFNGTTVTPVTLTGTAPVNVFSLPSQSTGTTTTQSTNQTGTISTALFAAGVGIPSIVAILLVVLLVRARGGPK